MGVKTICHQPGCNALCDVKYCDRHDKGTPQQQRKEYDRQRSQSPLRKLYQTAAWQRVRSHVPSRDPVCKSCDRDPTRNPVQIGGVDDLGKVQRIAADSAGVLKTKLVPQSSGGLHYVSGLGTNTVTTVKAGAGQLFGYYLFNTDPSSTVYVKIFDALSGSVTLGTTTPNLVLPLPAGSGANVLHDVGISFAIGICFAITSTYSGSAAPPSDVVVNFFYL